MALAALQAIGQHQRDWGDLLSRATANLGVLLASLNGAENPCTRHINPFEAEAFLRKAKRLVDPESARIFLDLNDAGELPFWVADHVDFALIEAAANAQ